MGNPQVKGRDAAGAERDAAAQGEGGSSRGRAW